MRSSKENESRSTLDVDGSMGTVSARGWHRLIRKSSERLVEHLACVAAIATAPEQQSRPRVWLRPTPAMTNVATSWSWIRIVK